MKGLVILFLLGTLVGPVVAAQALKRTSVWWIPAAAVTAFGIYLIVSVEDLGGDGDGGMGAWEDLGNSIQTGYGILMLVYGVVMLLVGAANRSKPPPPPPPPELPTARVVSPP